MKINTAGLDIIKYYEGWSSTVYKCPAGVGTIGYGSTWDMNGKRITMDHKKITKDYGELTAQYFKNEIEQRFVRSSSR